MAAQDYVDARYQMNELLYDAFRQHGVEMTYPHLNIHVRDDARA